MNEARLLRQRIKLQNFLATDINSILAQHPLSELQGKCLFLTGATGFVGYWLLLAIKCLNDTGAAIQVIALSRNPAHFLENAPEWKNLPWLNWLSGDIRDFAYPDQPIDAIIHGATDTSPHFATHHPQELYESIVQGTEHLLQFAARKNIQRVLLISSGAIYGEQPPNLTHLPEKYVPSAGTKTAPYAEGKREMERIGLRFAAENGLETLFARGFTFVGFGLAKHLAISQFIQNAQENHFIAVRGDGQAVRSYLYAADMAVWLLTILARGKPQSIYNVGSPHAVTLIEAAMRVRKLLAPDKRVTILDADASSPRRRYVPDTRLAENELGLCIWTTLDQALQKTLAEYELCHPASD